jgi:acyl carrier protein
MAEAASMRIGASEIAVPPQAGGDFILNQIMTILRGIRPAMAKGQAYDQNATLGDVGFTSLEMVNVMLAVETAFDLMIPAADITPGNFKTGASIAMMIGRLKPTE